MDKFLFSIIIPTFNPNLAFLDELLKTFDIVNFDKIEILLVDDGSNDGSSPQIIDLCKQHNVKYLTYDKNHGVSYARNFGLTHASGQYIVFCDYDDYLNVKLLNQLVEEKLTENLYFFAYSYENDFPNNNGNEKIVLKNEKEFGDFLSWPYIGDVYYSFRGCYCKLFNRDFLLNSKICFNSNLHFCEDTAFVLECINSAKRLIIFKDKYLYHHRVNRDSVTYKWNNNYNQFYKEYFDYITKKINDVNLLLPVYKDTVNIYSKVRICSSFKHLKIKQGFDFIKSDFVYQSCKVLKDINYDLKPEKKKFVDLILKRKFAKAYFFIVKNRILRKY